MASHPLDNPVWSSLTSQHAALARFIGKVARYPADVAPFVAVDADTASATATAALTALLSPGETVCFVGAAPALPRDWPADGPLPIAQMLCHEVLPVPDGPAIVPLGPDRVADMLALTARVYPHYFRPHTIDMGRYFGIYDGEVLAAMAGERMRFDGHQEISAVCTHPDYTGRRYAQRLVAELTNDILADGRQPFLHVSHQNTRAKALYERMGYIHRADIPLLTLRRP